MNNFLHTFFSPILYFDLFGGFGYICLASIIILIISTSTLKGTAFLISASIQVLGMTSLFIYTGLPIDPKDEQFLREQINVLEIEIIEDVELKQEREKILKGFSEVVDKGYINLLEEADTYKKLVEFNHQQINKKHAEYLATVEKDLGQRAQAQL